MEFDAVPDSGRTPKPRAELNRAYITCELDIDHWMWVCTQPSEPGKPCAEMQFSPKVSI
jgi:hypothetical protein